MTRRLLTALGLVAAFFLGWMVRDRDVASAQERKPIMMTRIYTGADGLSHSEEVPFKFANGGATEKHNLWRLCSHDHHLKTYRGWQVVEHPDGTRDLAPPAGHPPRDHPPPRE